MDKDQNAQSKLGPEWDHLFLSDTRSPEQRAVAESKERARRAGKGRKDWWKMDAPRS